MHSLGGKRGRKLEVRGRFPLCLANLRVRGSSSVFGLRFKATKKADCSWGCELTVDYVRERYREKEKRREEIANRKRNQVSITRKKRTK